MRALTRDCGDGARVGVGMTRRSKMSMIGGLPNRRRDIRFDVAVGIFSRLAN
jgi:hypothetical protein